MNSSDDLTPADLARSAARELGAERFAGWCAAVLTGEIDMDTLVREPDPDPRWLAGRAWTNWGPPDTWVERGLDYWPRVWSARGLLHAWHPIAEPAISVGLQDQHWRVREMCAKVTARHEVGSAADACGRLAEFDTSHRVRAAALRAIGVTGEAEHAGAVRIGLSDPRANVRSAAEMARDRLQTRLDRSLDELLDR